MEEGILREDSESGILRGHGAPDELLVTPELDIVATGVLENDTRSFLNPANAFDSTVLLRSLGLKRPGLMKCVEIYFCIFYQIFCSKKKRKTILASISPSRLLELHSDT